MNQPGARGSYLTFHCGDEIFAASAASIAEVFRHPPVTRVPHGPPSLLGMAGLRGTPVPVISLARLLGKPERTSAATRLLLLKGDPGIGLIVDRVGAVASLAVTEAAEADQPAISPLYSLDGDALRVIELHGLLRRDFAGTGVPRMPQPLAAPAEKPPAAIDSALLAFDLAGQAYALPLHEIEEVRTLPPRLASIAQSGKAVLGVARSGDRVLPIIAARHLLGLAPAANYGGVIVIRRGDSAIGLAVDRLRAIVRVPAGTIDPAPAILNRGEGEAQVSAICRPPGADGLLAVLSRERLFRDEKIASILAAGPSEGEMTNPTGGASGGASDNQARGEDAADFLIFSLGDEEYGLPLPAIEEVARLPAQLTRVPRAPAFIEGVFSLRGKLVPVIDQGRRFGAAGKATAKRRRVVVTSVDGRLAGFIVDTVREIVRLSPDQISATPGLAAEAGRLFSRIATLDQGKRLILLIEPQEMLNRAERDLLAGLDVPAPAMEN